MQLSEQCLILIQNIKNIYCVTVNTTINWSEAKDGENKGRAIKSKFYVCENNNYLYQHYFI